MKHRFVYREIAACQAEEVAFTLGLYQLFSFYQLLKFPAPSEKLEFIQVKILIYYWLKLIPCAFMKSSYFENEGKALDDLMSFNLFYNPSTGLLFTKIMSFACANLHVFRSLLIFQNSY